MKISDKILLGYETMIFKFQNYLNLVNLVKRKKLFYLYVQFRNIL